MLKVVIPLKTNSTRLHDKNLRNFFNHKSLFDIKAEQLLKVFSPKDIYVSSEDEIRVPKIVEGYGFNFLHREYELTLSSAKETEIVKGIVEKIEDKNADIMWVQVTQPLFDEFSEMVKVYQNLSENFDSIVAVKRITHHIIDERGNPVNFNFGYWHKISQELPIFFEVLWSAFIMKRRMLDCAWYQIGRNPYLYQSNSYFVDINDEKEFEVASILYSYYKKLKDSGGGGINFCLFLNKIFFALKVLECVLLNININIKKRNVLKNLDSYLDCCNKKQSYIIAFLQNFNKDNQSLMNVDFKFKVKNILINFMELKKYLKVNIKYIVR
ncbi:cytidylyltransferase domain-containing protein [Helicobacter kayseriensis]|uniref:cytidylyltransferase domain-containing protein n=1 Tax=Helicobacter kayseriensis TaxID=2905877 RepID=UPI001E2E77DA|nr:hypothetical protein [Helicobacter kayseriensis]MCE3046687.1 hypothetical protein [Helicobacter kayseriensis]MCE3048011.1 hypothetical protein [Helicobacter kayseriensis]